MGALLETDPNNNCLALHLLLVTQNLQCRIGDFWRNPFGEQITMAFIFAPAAAVVHYRNLLLSLDLVIAPKAEKTKICVSAHGRQDLINKW